VETVGGAFETPQEEFWAGDFGDSYTQRNSADHLQSSKNWFFSRALNSVQGVNSVLELGANVGLNIRSLRSLFPKLSAHAIEVNPKAADELRSLLGPDSVTQGSIHSFDSSQTWDLVLSMGLLIHVSPSKLPDVYRVMRKASKRYILIGEYYSRIPQSIEYRGFEDRLFRRDFAGEMLDLFPELILRDYGFIYHRDPLAPLDDISWFLLEVPSSSVEEEA